MECFDLETMAQGLDQTGLRDLIDRLEVRLMEFPQIRCPLKHVFSNGEYQRHCFNPQGALIVGKIQKKAHKYGLTEGEVSVLSVHGVQRIKGPALFDGAPGAKRVVFAHEDSIFVTIHPNEDDEQDLDVLEESLIAKGYNEIGNEVMP